MLRLTENQMSEPLSWDMSVKVLQDLLEGDGIRVICLIAESLAEQGSHSQNPDILTTVEGVTLGRSITQ